MKKYLYEVRPVKPVMTPEGKSTRRPFSSLLSKEEVMGYMRSCTIYRRFSNAIAPVRVTGSNLEELHRDKYKEEKTIISSPEQVAEIPLNEKPKDIEYPSFDEESSAVEEKNENPVEDPIVNEEEKVEDISTEEVTDEKSEIVEESIETTVEESVSEESVVETIEDHIVNENPVEEQVVETTETEVPVVNDVVEEKNENPVEEQVVETTEVNTDVKPTQNDQNRDNHTTKNIQVNYNKNKNKR